MISFRYHVVSIVAVFLGIVIGVVGGATALNGAVVGDLHRQVTDLKADNAKKSDTITWLTAQANNANVLASSYGSAIFANKLSNVSVVLVSAPGATATMTNAVSTEVTAAGGKVVAQIAMTKDLVDPRRAADVRSLVTTGVHPMGLTLPTTDDAGRLAGSLLGFVLLGKGQATDLTQAVAGLTTLNMVKVTGTPSSGKLIVVVAPGPVADQTTLPALTNLVAQMGATGPTVVAADLGAVGPNGLIGSIRSSDARKSVSTVDDADTALGQLTLVLAGAEAMTGKRGQYGVGGGVDGLLPGAAQ